MAYSILGLITGLGIARSKDLEGSSAAKVAVIPGILGFNAVSLVLAKVVADQEAESLPSPTPEKAVIEVSPTSHDYCDVNVGSTATKTFVVKNIGNAELDISATTIDLEPPFRIVSGGGSFNVDTGKAHDVEVSFTPDEDVEFKADLVITTSNDQDHPTVTIGLSGKGVYPPGIEVTPVSRDYSPLDDASRDKIITKCFIVSNKGTKTLKGTVALDPSTTSDFEIVSGDSFEIKGGYTHDVEVSLIPTSSKSEYKADLIIKSDDQFRPSVTIKLTGTVIKPPSSLP